MLLGELIEILKTLPPGMKIGNREGDGFGELMSAREHYPTLLICKGLIRTVNGLIIHLESILDKELREGYPITKNANVKINGVKEQFVPGDDIHAVIVTTDGIKIETEIDIIRETSISIC